MMDSRDFTFATETSQEISFPSHQMYAIYNPNTKFFMTLQTSELKSKKVRYLVSAPIQKHKD